MSPVWVSCPQVTLSSQPGQRRLPLKSQCLHQILNCERPRPYWSLCTKRHFCACTHWQELHFFWGKVCSLSSSAWLRWRHSSSNMEKSSYCCCYSHGRFNTGERNFHLSTPHSSPRTEQHTSPNWSRIVYPLLQKPVHSARIIFKFFECEILETGDCTAATLSRPNVKQHEVFMEFEMSLLNYLTQKLQKVTHHNEIGGEEGGLVAELTPGGGEGLSQRYMLDSLDLDWILPAHFHMCKLKKTILHLHDKLQLLSAAKLCKDRKKQRRLNLGYIQAFYRLSTATDCLRAIFLYFSFSFKSEHRNRYVSL